MKTGFKVFFFNLIRIIFEIRVECRGGEPGNEEKREKEVRSIDTLNLFHYFAWSLT